MTQPGPVWHTRTAAVEPPTKAAWRAMLRAARARLSASDRAAADAARTIRALALVDEVRPGTVACYLSAGDEPDTFELVDALVGRGVRVLAPVLSKGAMVDGRRAPNWAQYSGPEALTAGWHGIPEPVGDDLGFDALGDAELIFTSGLGGSPTGHRLGQGGGWYDRALAGAAASAVVVTLLGDDEVFDWLPHDERDRRVAGFVLPGGVWFVEREPVRQG